MTWDDVVEMCRDWPGVVEGTSYGTPALKAGKAFLVRLRPEDNSLVLVNVSFDERDILVESRPDIFHYTAHYRDYPAVLARLEAIDPDALRPFLARTWRAKATARLKASPDLPMALREP